MTNETVCVVQLIYLGFYNTVNPSHATDLKGGLLFNWLTSLKNM